MNIKNNLNKLNLQELEKDIYFFETDKNLTELSQKDIPNNHDYSYYIFLSRHRSESKRPTFTVHTSGNLTKDNSHGGNIEEVCPCDAVLNSILLKNIYKHKLNEKELNNFEISFEAVHHGPTDLNVPSVFVEIGSSEKEWAIEKAGEIMAKSVMDSIISIKSRNYENLDKVIGFGGGHYAPRFTKLVLLNKCYVGYIVPKYAKISENMLKQICTKQKFDYILFDWKGLNSEDRKRYIEFFEKNNIPWKKVKDLC